LPSELTTPPVTKICLVIRAPSPFFDDDPHLRRKKPF
jgi:hypothetical protein